MKKLLCLVLAAVMMLSFAACGGEKAESDLAYIKDNGKMVIGYTVYAPMNFTDDNGNFRL